MVAIGARKGLEFSLTRGVLSSLRDAGDILQIDAPINPGNSGGPVLDRSGCVVGVATFKLSDSEGLNFAVAASVVEHFLLHPIGRRPDEPAPAPVPQDPAGEVAPCCSALYRLLEGYLVIYRRAAASIRLFRGVGGLKVEIPYKYLFRHGQSDEARIVLHLRRLVDGEALRDSSHGKVYRLHPAFVEKNEVVLAGLGAEPQAIGSLLGAEYFVFSRALDPQSQDIKAMLEVTVFDFLPDIVTSERPHRRLADINTWRQFHRLASYLTDSFDSGERNILAIAGLTLDHSVKRNTFVPQFGFLLPHGRAAEAEYYGPAEINDLLLQQEVRLPQKSFFEYAEVGQDMRPRSARLT